MANYSRPLKMYVDAAMPVRVECRRCERSATFDAAELARRWGFDIDPAFLPFRCRGCGARNARVGPDFKGQKIKLETLPPGAKKATPAGAVALGPPRPRRR